MFSDGCFVFLESDDPRYIDKGCDVAVKCGDVDFGKCDGDWLQDVVGVCRCCRPAPFDVIMRLFYGDFRVLADVVSLVREGVLDFLNFCFKRLSFDGRSALHHVEALLRGVRVEGEDPVVWAFGFWSWFACFSDYCGSGLFDSCGCYVVSSVPGHDDEEGSQKSDWSRCPCPMWSCGSL